METVAICDTEPIAVEGLRRLFDSLEGLRVVAAEHTLAQGKWAVDELSPNLLFVDKAFGIHAVMDWLKSIRSARSKMIVIVWGTAMTEPEALRFLQAGASGVIRKTANLGALMQCLDTVRSGVSWMQDEMLRETERPVRSARSPLTSRELQVMELVERGMKNKDIAQSLGIRTGTVKIHLKHIFEKTGIRGRYGLALSGLKEKGLLAASAV